MVRIGTKIIGGAAALLVLATGRAAAHIDYVTEGEPPGSPAELLNAVFSSPLSIALLVGGGIGAAAVCGGYLRFSSQITDIEVARRTLRSYRPYLPWMLRLSVGLPLVGAGFAGYLFSPAVGVEARLLQVGIGFFMLFGLATRIVAVVGIVAYLVSLTQHFPTLLLAGEYVAGFLGILMLGSGQPSADMLLHRLVVTDGTIMSRFREFPTAKDVLSRFGIGGEMAPVYIRVVLGLNFVYLGLFQKILEPQQAMAVVTKYDLTSVVPVSPELWVFGAGLVEAGVGLLFITGTFTRGAATIGFIMLSTTLFGLPDDPVLAHITLFGLTSALMVTGAGKYSLDASVIPGLRRRLDPGIGEESSQPAD